MHLLFADWHRLVDIEPTSESLSSRWSTIEALIERGLDGDSCLGLIRLACELESVYSGVFARAFKETESTFPMVSNSRLLAVLAGSSILAALEKKDEAADLLAYGVLCADAAGHQLMVAEVLGETRQYIATESVGVRSSRAKPVMPAPMASKAPKELPEVSSGVDERFADPEGVRRLFASLVPLVSAQVNALRSFSSELEGWVDHKTSTVAEEVDLLWWLVGADSRTLGQRWGDVEPAVAVAAAAIELSQLVAELPAPVVVSEFLVQQLASARVTGDLEATALRDAVRGLPAAPSGPPSLSDLCPLLSEGSSAHLDRPLPAADWGSRLLLECLLLRALHCLEA